MRCSRYSVRVEEWSRLWPGRAYSHRQGGWMRDTLKCWTAGSHGRKLIASSSEPALRHRILSRRQIIGATARGALAQDTTRASAWVSRVQCRAGRGALSPRPRPGLVAIPRCIKERECKHNRKWLCGIGPRVVGCRGGTGCAANGEVDHLSDSQYRKDKRES